MLSHSENTIQWDIKLSRDLDESRSPLEVTRLGPFLKGYKSLQYGKPLASKSTCTRIAILDDGVDQVSPVWAEINKRGQRAAITGASFVVDNDGNESPWWLSHTAHGTQLAGVILEMDPFCELFIAKVMLRRDEVDLGRVISVRKCPFHVIQVMLATNSCTVGHQMGNRRESRHDCVGSRSSRARRRLRYR